MQIPVIVKQQSCPLIGKPNSAGGLLMVKKRMSTDNPLDAQKGIVLPLVRHHRFRRSSPLILVDTDTESPVPEITDEFWQILRDQTIAVLRNAYVEPGYISFFVILFFIPLSMYAALGQLYFTTMITFLTAGWLIHSGLWSCISPRLFSRFSAPFFYDAVVLICGLLLPMYGIYVQSVILLLLGATSVYCFPFAVIPITPESYVDSFIRAVNANCPHNLKGYKLSLIPESHAGEMEQKSLCFEQITTTENEVTNKGEVFLGDEEYELRVYPFLDTTRCLRVSQKERSECYSLLNADENPSHVSAAAWDAFVEDLSSTISMHDKVAKRIPLVMAAHLVCSITYFVAYNAINFLLPLHMTSSLIADLVFRREMKQKFASVMSVCSA